jgi:hypothetical protein
MAHTAINFPTKKALKEAVASGERVTLAPAMFPPKENGIEYVSGPHEYHKWYAQVKMQDGIIVSVK